RRVPAFRIFSNRTLRELATALPRDEDELLEVHGIGPALLRKHGEDILHLIRKNVSE
ncbi:HRDC domain-containing protein, partial [bacterium]|nr:HRDC domain-containing protein [bacterium]